MKGPQVPRRLAAWARLHRPHTRWTSLIRRHVPRPTSTADPDAEHFGTFAQDHNRSTV